eukprot:m51a1_g8131 putative glycoside hydrolase family 7 protein (571) ;mRNA; r:213479-215259
MKCTTLVLAAALFGLAVAQQAGTKSAENKPKISTFDCTANGCTSVDRAVTMDANWRWLHHDGTNCYSGTSWNTDFCGTPEQCAKQCALDGADYPNTYGVTASGSALTLKFVTKGQYATNIGSRMFLLETPETYKLFQLINREFAFDVDVSQLPCGLNGALYFSEMAPNGGKGLGDNAAGAAYGTGYCDAQCPHDVKFINGAANLLNWNSNSAVGKWGSCCGEMDIWEANKMAAALTPHNCEFQGQKRCEDPQSCGDNNGYRYSGVCDKDGCDLNAYRMGDRTFLGPSMTVDTSKPFTVVTQFVTSDGTDAGDLVEIRRFYKQNGKVIAHSHGKTAGLTAFNSISDAMCTAQKSVFGDTDDFKAKGGMKAQGEMLRRGMVLVLSLWDDHDSSMLWLDSNSPATADASKPGVARGSCPTTSGKPSDLESQSPDASVVYSNIKFGPIGSTTPGVPTPTPSASSSAAHQSSAAHDHSSAAHQSSAAHDHSSAAHQSSAAHDHSSAAHQSSAAHHSSAAHQSSAAHGHSSSAHAHSSAKHQSSSKRPTPVDSSAHGSASAVAVGAVTLAALMARL